MKIVSIKDYNKKINITDCKLNTIMTSLDFPLFTEEFIVDCKISVGDLMLIRYINECLKSEHDVIISLGYKS